MFHSHSQRGVSRFIFSLVSFEKMVRCLKIHTHTHTDRCVNHLLGSIKPSDSACSRWTVVHHYKSGKGRIREVTENRSFYQLAAEAEWAERDVDQVQQYRITITVMFKEKTCKMLHETAPSCLLGGIMSRLCSVKENKTKQMRGGFVLVVFHNLCVNRLMTEQW